MSCPTCTDGKRCVVDRRCTNKMKMQSCYPDNVKDVVVPDFKPPYYETNAAGKPFHPMLTHYVPELHNRVEGFGFLGMNPMTVLLIVAVVALVVYMYQNRQQPVPQLF